MKRSIILVFAESKQFTFSELLKIINISKFSSTHTVMDFVMFTFRMKVYGVKCLDINSEFKFKSGQCLVQAKNSIQNLGSSTKGFLRWIPCKICGLEGKVLSAPVSAGTTYP